MIDILYDEVEEFEPISITDELIKREKELNLNRLSNEKKDTLRLSKIDDTWYFCKRIREEYIEYLINELIGMYYARLINAKTVNYLIRVRNNKNTGKKEIYLLSENFWCPNSIDVCKVIRLNKEDIGYIDQPLKLYNFGHIRSDEFDSDLMKMTGIDLVMHQTDRSCVSNTSLLNIDGKILLNKLFDFEFAYGLGSENNYSNPFLVVKRTEEGVIALLETFKCAYPIFKEILDVDLKEILSLIQENYPVLLDERYKETLLRRDKSYRNSFVKVLK